ncbi:MAG: ribosome silencing factor [Firmicutes bacterium]|nr:ribosome silencing factor [Bacillota bacterium]
MSESDLSTTPQTVEPLALAIRLAEVAQDRKAIHPIVLDIRPLTVIADYFLIASGRTTVQVQVLSDRIREAAEAMGCPPRAIEGAQEGRWIVLDFGEVVVHLFRDDDRRFYDLERLWGEATLCFEGEEEP